MSEEGVKSSLPMLPVKAEGKITRQDFSKPAAYALHHVASNAVYVGSTQDLYRRINQHRTRLLAGEHRNHQLQSAFDADPRFDLSFQTTESKEAALEIEDRYLKEHWGPSILNLSKDAYVSGKGQPISEKQREVLRQATLAQFQDDAAREAHGQKGKEVWRDPNYRAKQQARRPTSAQKTEISTSMKERWKDPQYREAMIDSRKHRRRPVVIDGVEFVSMSEAATVLGLPPSTLKSRIYRQKPSKTEGCKK